MSDDIFKNSHYKIRDSIDVYLLGDGFVMFYFFNIREHIKLKISDTLISIIPLLNGDNSVSMILEKLYSPFNEINNNSLLELEKFLTYLNEKNVITLINKTEKNLDENFQLRFDRQINFFDDMFQDKGFELTLSLTKKTVLIFGIGKMGGGIVTSLLRAGIKNFIIFDSGEPLEYYHKTSYIYYNDEYVGYSKVIALEKYLKRIDKDVNITTYKETMKPDTDISYIFSNKKIDIVINTISTPYILYSSLKIEKECQLRNIPLYIAGGFTAHLGSTGELIFPPLTPCIKCHMEYFNLISIGWNPSANSKAVDTPNLEIHNYEEGEIIGFSLFSISMASLQIINFLIGNYNYISRGELDFKTGEIAYLDIKKNQNCKICKPI